MVEKTRNQFVGNHTWVRIPPAAPATEQGLPCSVAFSHQKRDALPDGVLFRISKREAPPAYAGGAVLISLPVPYRKE